jgi:hypothetical protein
MGLVTARFGIAAAMMLLLGGLVFALWPTAKRGGFSEVLSTRRADALGAKAFYAVLQLAGLEPLRRGEDLESLDIRGVLFSLSPEAPKPPLPGLPRLPIYGRFERRELMRWVEAGGNLVVVSSRQTRLHADFGLDLTDEDRPRPLEKRRGRRALFDWAEELQRRLRPKEPEAQSSSSGPQVAYASSAASPLTGGAKELSAPRFYHFDLASSDPRTLFAHAGKAVAAAVAKGQGLAVFVSTPYLAGNVGLREGDNLRFLYGLAEILSGGGRIYFDEYHHGQRKERGFIALASAYNLHFAIAQMVLAAILAVWAARRLPRRRFASDRSERGVGEQLAAMATLYERGGLAPYAVSQLWSATLAALATRLRVRGPRSVRALRTALEARGRTDLAERLQALDAQHAAFGPKIRERELIAIARSLAQLRLDLEARAVSAKQEPRP